MKICKICGREIVNGVNGCAMAGDVCFDCKPWRMKLIPATRWGDDGVAEYWEGQILSRQENFF